MSRDEEQREGEGNKSEIASDQRAAEEGSRKEDRQATAKKKRKAKTSWQ